MLNAFKKTPSKEGAKPAPASARTKPSTSRGSGRSGAFSVEVLDGRKVKALLKDEKEFVAFLNKCFDTLDKDAGGTLTRDELKPALVRFGTLLGLPPPGTASEADKMVDKMFTHLLSQDKSEEIDRDTFVNISKNFLASVATGLEERPLVVKVFDGSVLQELAENEDLFDEMVDDFFKQFDEDNSGHLTRDEILPALISLGLVPPTGSKPEADALLSRILGKYAGKDLQLNKKEFRAMLRDLMKELSEELKNRPVVVNTEAVPVMSAPSLRKLVKDPKRLSSLGEATFKEWDTLKTGKLGKSDVMKGFKDLCQSHKVPILDEEQAETLCLSACLFMNADVDATGFVEREEFDPLLKEILIKLAERLDKDPTAAAAATTQSSAGWLTEWWKSDSVSAAEEGAEEASPDSPPPPKTLPPPTEKPAAAAGKPAVGARSAEDIKAKYNYKPSEAVLKARVKLEERQKKLQDVANNAESLENNASEFENLSKQLAEKMKKKWW